ncbi:pre-rRNA-processing protein PNO1 [Aspergillus homomorphus CBS 101889]|uniref:Pre-rRNA-processing protein PNO1 n=1 Tax=Aspergillus homomorphus (strain CBS 101889) TaxID=1450537 RepID=A0A395HL83_ASPHC|nr:eukaryotic type KH-domain (KH-domain type I) [Aspergillus homomorphus CBS 101889]RAL08692.1 eukaryotic type KH-domain (KH-domain type I) [Aspergillus homomorphus CBS 101889]
MPAPTALRQPAGIAMTGAPLAPVLDHDEEILIDTQPLTDETSSAFNFNSEPINDADVHIDEEGRPIFTPAKDVNRVYRVETRKVPVPPHRMTPLKASWSRVYPPLVEHLKLQVRMNIKNRAVELRTSRFTTDTEALQKGEDFVKAFTLGFDVDDAIALLRLDDLYIRSFEIRDIKTLNGEHLSRAIGRCAGKDGRTKFAIENATRTRIVIADQKIHLLGGIKNVEAAQQAIVHLIMGSPPGKVYGNLRKVASRMKERF